MYYIVHSMRQLTHALEPPVTARANARYRSWRHQLMVKDNFVR